ncbi:MAG: hypothetical protein LBF66_00535 [Holosporales bacterium]|nr:hypothetical protein [Holosporales bacterium]
MDVCFNEDKACIRNDNAAENMDIVRKWALATLKWVQRKPGESTKSLKRMNAMSFKHLSNCLLQIFRA